MQRLLFETETGHHHIAVYETDELDGQKGRFRVLQFASQANQGALDMDNPDRILFEYPKAIIHLMEHNVPDFEEVFMIGHGIGTLSRYFSEKNVTVSELDPVIVQISQTYFGYSLNNVQTGDGRALLEHQPAGKFDYVVLDAFDAEGTPRHLVSTAFFQTIADKLKPEGSVLINLTGRAGHDHLLGAIGETMGRHFAYTRAFSLKADSRGDVVNFILAGSARPLLYLERQMAGFKETVLPPGYLIWDK
ncbi:spermidine synthase [Paenibacillus yonginensis]|uniref:Spermidine synthase n=1 Tax=Paenibacillus yonginensis TaxID=1462996 RepID=A0A1B1MYL4_9BACL|nr:fused MFS/spermidine synthase [Paenibacillus yonginensis]ANS74274.1 spermidine synthase [Paenibacillus yonginensis]